MGAGVDGGGPAGQLDRTSTTDEEASDVEGHVIAAWPVWSGEGERTGRRIRARPHDGFRGDWRTVFEVRTRGEEWEERTTLGYANDLEEIEVREP